MQDFLEQQWRGRHKHQAYGQLCVSTNRKVSLGLDQFLMYIQLCLQSCGVILEPKNPHGLIIRGTNTICGLELI